jgi:hypothetical protein
VSRLRQLVQAAYSFGMKPDEVGKYTYAELSEWVMANRKRQLEGWKFLSKVGYSTGVVASMALAKSRPAYEEVWNFGDERKVASVEELENAMMAWAANANRLDKESRDKKKK